jgi:YidC/Oxa1 family membrane protein insertase
MQAILSAIGLVFGKLMYFIYNTVGFENYALSLVLFTIVYKLILLPLSIKQIKSTQRMQEFQPELARIQERYKNDKEKLNEETMKFYQEKKYNPSSGCLPMLIQLPIIIALFYVIRMPMSYMLDIPAKAVGQMTIESVVSGDLPYGAVGKEAFEQVRSDPTEVYKKFNAKDYYFEIKLFSIIDRKPEIIDKNAYLTDQQKTILKKFNLRMFNFFNLGVPPTYKINEIAADPANKIPAIIMLILAVATTFFTTKLSMPPQPSSSKGAGSGCANNSMLWISPMVTLWIGLTTPSGLSFYWTINNVLSFVQQKALNNHIKTDKNDKNIVEKKAVEDVKETVINKEEKKVGKVNNKRSKKRR